MNHIEYAEKVNIGIQNLKGIGPKKSILFNKLGIYSIWDLLYCFPRNYEDRSVISSIRDICDGQTCTVNGVVASSVIEKKVKNKMSLFIFRFEDGNGILSVKWFSSPFNRNKIKKGMRLSLYGNVSKNGSLWEMVLRDFEVEGINENCGKIVPVYALTSGLTQNDFKKAIKSVFEFIDDIPESLPQKIVNENNLMSLTDAVYAMHHPENFEVLSKAKGRLSFEEMLILCLVIKKTRQMSNISTNVRVKDCKCISEFSDKLPFELTDEQKKAVNDICRDFRKDVPMNRLLQGDVGSGKTVVAACAAYAVCKNSYQVAIMAPTELLATQHFETFSAFFKGFDVKISLLTSAAKNKQEIYRDISEGRADIVIGTHALIQEKVKFNSLGLCVTDEQHRFGVKQRALLADSDNNPHILVMSATPIPRTLSLVVYGDLDVSVIKAPPRGRQKVDTFCINSGLRQRLNSFINDNIKESSQCFVVCPLIETSDKLDVTSGVEVFERLKETFPDFGIQFLHGKMSSAEKDSIMESFRNKEFDILVSTTVIEVGIDIPNATLMVIENAERFGLSQLHQLRGRVGRGSKKSYCILVCDSQNEESKERMQVMCKTSDGFELAAYDLNMRGCGEFFGTRQHGLPELRVANLFTDMRIFENAKTVADKLGGYFGDETSEYSELFRRVDKLISNMENIKIFN